MVENKLEDAIAFAVAVHKGQKDKAGELYILHPLRVMIKMDSETEKIVAVLHDVVEDSVASIETLRSIGFPEEVLKAVDCISQRDGEFYSDYLKRVGTNSIARKVKVADLEDNMNIMRLSTLEEKDLKRLNKYLTEWKTLMYIVKMKEK